MAMRQWDGGRGNTLMAWPGRLHSLFDVDEVAPKVVMPRAPWQRPLCNPIFHYFPCHVGSLSTLPAASPVPLESGFIYLLYEHVRT